MRWGGGFVDEDEDEVKVLVYSASILTPANPKDLKEAFGMMIDEITAQAEGVVIDWGTAVVQSVQAVSQEQQELVILQMGVEGIGL